MQRIFVLVLGLTVLVGLAAAGPFGGDDTGFVPPSFDALKTESKAMLLGSKVSYKIVKCHIDLASDSLAGQGIGNSEDACENATTSKLDGQLNKLCAQGTCPACLQATTATLGADIEAARDADNGSIYCAGTTPFGDDDTGFVPPDVTTFKCEASVGKNLAKLRLCIVKCHIKMAKYAVKGAPFDDDACESTDPLRACRVKYDKIRDRIAPICPACLDAATQDTLADTVETNEDATLGAFYCASPSGAFLD
jgi:hypothetical protein